MYRSAVTHDLLYPAMLYSRGLPSGLPGRGLASAPLRHSWSRVQSLSSEITLDGTLNRRGILVSKLKLLVDFQYDGRSKQSQLHAPTHA